MALGIALPLFVLSVAVTLAAAAVFADRLDHIGPRIGLPEPLTGLVTALAADGPEISAALFALAQGEKRVGLGVVLGSNVFNLAAMIGVSAILAGAVHIGRRALLIEGAVAMLATLLGAGVITGALAPAAALVGIVAVLVPYLLLIGRRTPRTAQEPHHLNPAVSDEAALWRPIALACLAVVLIVVGSAGMVDSALSIADSWQVPDAVVGVLVLATLTSIPNAFTAVRLGVGHRGAALVSETLNSNTINLAVGVILPAVVVSLGSISGLVRFDLAWLILMTTVALLLLARPGGARHRAGVILVVLYLVFVSVQLARA